MAGMTQEQADQWAKTHAKGRWHFILIQGVLLWGGVTAVLWSAFMSVFSDQGFIGVVVIALPLFMAGGFFWGLFMWRSTHRRYEAFNAKENDPL